MTTTCEACKTAYDDARCTTICPHQEFLTEEQARRKDAAVKLLGRMVARKEQPRGPFFRCIGVNWEGNVWIDDGLHYSDLEPIDYDPSDLILAPILRGCAQSPPVDK